MFCDWWGEGEVIIMGDGRDRGWRHGWSLFGGEGVGKEW